MNRHRLRRPERTKCRREPRIQGLTLSRRKKPLSAVARKRRQAERQAEREAERRAERQAQREAEREAERQAERQAEREAQREAEQEAQRQAEQQSTSTSQSSSSEASDTSSQTSGSSGSGISYIDQSTGPYSDLAPKDHPPLDADEYRRIQQELDRRARAGEDRGKYETEIEVGRREGGVMAWFYRRWIY